MRGCEDRIIASSIIYYIIIIYKLFIFKMENKYVK